VLCLIPRDVIVWRPEERPKFWPECGDNTANARDRDVSSSPDERYHSFIHMQKHFGPDAFWEIAVSSGTYSVHLSSAIDSNLRERRLLTCENLLICVDSVSCGCPCFDRLPD
jgi:hypothetical protein